MKKTVLKVLLAALLFLLAPGGSRATTEENRKMTLMIYMCGSNLESGYGSASNDLMEMIENCPDDDSVTVLVMTGGSARWSMGFEEGKTQIHEISRKGMRTVWPSVNEESISMNMGDPATLKTVLRYGEEYDPAGQYALILWEHGGGPMAGICWDEIYSMDNLSVHDLDEALSSVYSSYFKLEWIGFDACLMGTLEVACTVAPYARYMIASQETEPSLGWNYAFLRDLGNDADGRETGRRIADLFFDAADGKGEDLTMSCIDLSRMTLLCQSLDRLFSPLAGALSADNFPDASVLRMRSVSFGKSVAGDDDSASDLVDLGDLLRRMDALESESALTTLESAVIYNRTNVEGATGLSVYFPYHNKDRYANNWHDSYRQIQGSPGFASYIFRFGSLLTDDDRTDWSGLRTRIEGENSQGDGYVFACALTEKQAASLVSARMLVLQPSSVNSGVDDSYVLVGDYPAELGEDGVLRATYNSRLLYAVTPEGNMNYVHGPLGYTLVNDQSGGTLPAVFIYRDDPLEISSDQSFIYFDLPEQGDIAPVQRIEIRDPATGTYSGRIPYEKERYGNIRFMLLDRCIPPNNENGTLPAFRDWPYDNKAARWINVDSNSDWHLEFIDQSLIAQELFVLFEVTDVQQNSFCSSMIRVPNPARTAIDITSGAAESDLYWVELSAEIVNSIVDRYIVLDFAVTNRTDTEMKYTIQNIRLNGIRLLYGYDYETMQPGETKKLRFTVFPDVITGMEDLSLVKATIAMEPQPAGEKTEEEISFSLAPVNAGEIAADYSILGAAEHKGITVELLNVKRDKEDDLELLLHVTNGTDQEIELNPYYAVAVNGIQSHASRSYKVLPGCDIIADIRVDDRVCESKINYMDQDLANSIFRHIILSPQLQKRHGHQSVETVSLVYRRTSEGLWSDLEMVTLRLATQPEMPDFSLEERPPYWYDVASHGIPSGVRLLPLLDWPQARIGVERVLAGVNGLAAAVEIENHTDRFLNLYIKVTAADGECVGFHEDSYYIMPGCTLCDTLSVELDRENVSSVTLKIDGLAVEKPPEVEISFSSPISLGEGGSTVLEADQLTAKMPAAPERIENTLMQTGVRYHTEQVHYDAWKSERWADCSDQEYTVVLWPDGAAEVKSNGTDYGAYAWAVKEDGSIRLFSVDYFIVEYRLYIEEGWLILYEDVFGTLYRMKPDG